MDTFNLRWPGGDAILHTDGVRCRVVWRAENGMGGTIDNSDLAKKRVIGGLAYAPNLPAELRHKGFTDLAAEIEAAANALPKPAPATPVVSPTKRIDAWLASLPGSTAFEACGTRRALKWHQGKTWPESLALKPPGKTGNSEWVLKVSRDKVEYFTASEFAGVCACLASMPEFAAPTVIDAFFEGCKALRHKAVTVARDAWIASG
jgi:hypothetical protein